MALVSQPSPAARWALILIIVGALTLVWTVVWWFYLRTVPPTRESLWFLCYGFMATGAVLLVIGFGVGRIGREARHAELAPPEAAANEAMVDQLQATRPVVAPAAAPVQPVGVPHAPSMAAPHAVPVAPAQPAPPAAPAPRV